MRLAVFLKKEVEWLAMNEHDNHGLLEFLFFTYVLISVCVDNRLFYIVIPGIVIWVILKHLPPRDHR